MAKEKLNLFEFPSNVMAEAGATSAQIVRCQVIDARIFGTTFHCIPNYIGGHSGILPIPILQNSPEHPPFSHF
jgi:hypothetical protein